MILREESRDDYEEKLKERIQFWDPKFKNYFFKEVDPVIERVSKWKAKEIGWEG